MNYFGTVRCTREAVKCMKKEKNGHVVNVTSIGGLIGQPFNEIYCGSKVYIYIYYIIV